MNLIKLVEMRFRTSKSKSKSKYGLLECATCGAQRVGFAPTRKTTMCRACSGRRLATHRETGSRLYTAYASMKKRCNNENDKAFKNYGFRGITVCADWSKYANFADWAKSNGYKEGLTLDRIDNEKGYSPENCRWVTTAVQNANRRMPSDNSSGYIGVRCEQGSYSGNVSYEGKRVYFRGFDTAEEAARARDKYIIDNNLPHTLNFPNVEALAG